MELADLVDLLKACAGRIPVRAYIVGGSVRDGLLGRPFADLDLTVADGRAESLARAAGAATGGTVFSLGDRVRTWRVALPAGRGGSPVHYLDCVPLEGAIERDLGRRDFTINAMAVPLETVVRDLTDFRDVIDPYGGRGDLGRRMVRMVSPGGLGEDPVRLLRAVRLAAELGFSLAEGTERAIRERAGALGGSAPERVRPEFCRVLAAEDAATWLELLDRLGLLEQVLPECMAGKGCEQPREHHWDVFAHEVETVAAVEALLSQRLPVRLEEKRPYLRAAADVRPVLAGLDGYFERPAGDLARGTLLRLAGLLHDVAKPATKSRQGDGRIRFFGHSELGAEMVEAALKRLRFSDFHIRTVSRMVREHLRPGQWSSGGLPTPRALYRYFRDLGEVAVDTVYLNLADHLAARGPELEPARWAAHVYRAQYALESYLHQETVAAEPRLVSGHDLMQELGLGPGRLVGLLLAEVEEARRAGDITTREEALELARSLSATRRGEREQN